MIAINLLPEEKKQQIVRNKTFWSILRQEILFVIVFFIFAAILYGNNLILDIEADSVEQTTKNEIDRADYKEIREFEKKFQESNEKVSKLNKIEQDHFFWSTLFEDLSRKDLAGIQVKEISNNNFSIVLRGRADTREELISFQEKISLDNCFQNIDVPLSNLVMKSNIDFVMNFDIDQKCIKNKR